MVKEEAAAVEGPSRNQLPVGRIADTSLHSRPHTGGAGATASAGAGVRSSASLEPQQLYQTRDLSIEPGQQQQRQ